jgi:hypothetical protein
MNWSSIAIIAEIVSAMAVSITLVYLALQIGQAKAATLGQLVASED